MEGIFSHQLRRPAVWALLVLFAAVLFPALSGAQVAGTGNIQGIVSDRTGAVIPDAAVTLTAASTQVAHIAKTDGAGAYTFPNLEPGTYTISAASQGFQTYTSTGNVLEVGSSISINIAMTIGTSDQQIEVESEGLALQTEDASFKQTIDSTALTEMPLNGRQMDDAHHAFGWIHAGARRRFYRKQILLPDHRGLHCRQRRQYDAMEARWRR